MKIYDVSLDVHNGMIAYPGNPRTEIKAVSRIPRASSNVSRITLGSHAGTHVDARKHVENGASGIDAIPLTHLYGKSRVLDLRSVDFGEGIRPQHLKKTKIRRGEIALLKTKNSSTGYRRFRKDFVYLTEEGAAWLAKKRVKTVGIDYLSIQKFRTGYCAAHCVLLKKGITVFEGLDLSKVRPGSYVFVGLPLKIKGCDGAPARAILIK